MMESIAANSYHSSLYAACQAVFGQLKTETERTSQSMSLWPLRYFVLECMT